MLNGLRFNFFFLLFEDFFFFFFDLFDSKRLPCSIHLFFLFLLISFFLSFQLIDFSFFLFFQKQTHGHQNWRRGLDITARWLLPSFVILVNVAILIYFPGESWRGLVIWLTLAGPFVVVVMVYIAHRKIVNMNEEERKPMLVNE